ncbi:MAG: STAS domain-containing protein [Candidatus Krumholzibacteriota bacterium]
MKNKPQFSAEMELDAEVNAQIWRLAGKMVTGSCCYDFLDSVRENIANGQINAILDMTDISWTNSTGVGVLASIFNAAGDAGGAMVLVGANQRVEATLKIVNLWPVVATFDSLAEALEHLKGK